MLASIERVMAREILDSRGYPSIEVCIRLLGGVVTGIASVPSGASIGLNEALEVRDQDPMRCEGKGVKSVIQTIHDIIAPALIGLDVTDQVMIDQTMIALDGSSGKSHLGANAILGVSLASARAAAAFFKQPLYIYLASDDYLMPTCFMNIINGGCHASNQLDIQEFMIVPHGFTSFSEGLWAGVEVYHRLKRILQKKNYGLGLGDEGGFSDGFSSHEVCLDLLIEAIQTAGFSETTQVSLALDCASSEFFHDGRYVLKSSSYLSSEELVAYWAMLVDRYPIVSIEDGMAQNDVEGWRVLTDVLSSRVQLVGDDLFTTNLSLIQQGVQKKIANSVLIKPNQVGTLTETMAAIRYALEHGYRCMISHRSGETLDAFISDLCVATQVGQIKTGAPARGERVAKYNRLLEIGEYLSASETC